MVFAIRQCVINSNLLKPQSLFRGQTTQILGSLSPKRDCSPKRVNSTSINIDYSETFPEKKSRKTKISYYDMYCLLCTTSIYNRYMRRYVMKLEET